MVKLTGDVEFAAAEGLKLAEAMVVGAAVVLSIIVVEIVGSMLPVGPLVDDVTKAVTDTSVEDSTVEPLSDTGVVDRLHFVPAAVSVLP